MASIKRDTLKSYFQTGYHPTEAQFAELLDAVLVIEDDSTIEVSGRMRIERPIGFPNSGTIIYSGVDELDLPGGDNNFRIRHDDDFFGGTQDALVIEKTDVSHLIPEGGIAFTNTGSDGVERLSMAIRGEGNVGIGTSTPDPEVLLHISAGDSGDAILRLEADVNNLDENNNPLIQLRQDGGAIGVNIGFNETGFGDNNFGIGTRNGNGDFWDTFVIGCNEGNNGNIGIGTQPTAAKLHIFDSSPSPVVGLHVQQSSIGLATGNASVVIEDSDATLELISGNEGDWGSGINFIEGNGVGANTGTWSIIRTTLGYEHPGLRIKYGNNPNPAMNDSLLTITPDGRVGIGRVAPEGKLDVEGAIQLIFYDDETGNYQDNGIETHEEGQLVFYRNGLETISMVIDDETGNVGIGTGTGTGIDSPQANLHISSFGDAVLRLEADKNNDNENANPMIQLLQDGGIYGVNIGFNNIEFGENNFGIGRRWNNVEYWDTFIINPMNGDISMNGDVSMNGILEFDAMDYAEYFETQNRKAIPVATAVAVGKNGKIQPAKKGETPIGIVSAKPGILGNSPREWPGKYLKDELGQRIMEEYEEDELVPKTKKAGKKDKKITDSKEKIVKDKDGKPVMVKSGKKIKKQRYKINPKYDENIVYVPRKERDEWCCVGLLGQLPLRKGQPIAPTWVKLYEISDKADMWLVK